MCPHARSHWALITRKFLWRYPECYNRITYFLTGWEIPRSVEPWRIPPCTDNLMDCLMCQVTSSFDATPWLQTGSAFLLLGICWTLTGKLRWTPMNTSKTLFSFNHDLFCVTARCCHWAHMGALIFRLKRNTGGPMPRANPPLSVGGCEGQKVPICQRSDNLRTACNSPVFAYLLGYQFWNLLWKLEGGLSESFSSCIDFCDFTARALNSKSA